MPMPTDVDGRTKYCCDCKAIMSRERNIRNYESRKNLPPNSITCQQCGKAFATRYKNQKYCGKQCQNQSQLVYDFSPRPCLGCGETFTPKHLAGGQRFYERGKYCSRRCLAKGNSRRYSELRASKETPPEKSMRLRSCRVCGAHFTEARAAKRCPRCRSIEEARLARKRAVRPCPVCNSMFLPSVGQRKWCSDECGKQARRERNHEKIVEKRRKARGRYRDVGRKNRHRARQFGVLYQPFNPRVIFQRDGWICQICGTPTPETLRGTYAPNAPELDHVLSMSQGGDHLPENCQCACRSCNSAKGRAVPFRLPPLRSAHPAA